MHYKIHLWSVTAVVVVVALATVVSGAPAKYEAVATDNLEAVLIFMRHGVRAPWTTYPKDPNVNVTNRWPNGRSQLTSFGIQQATNIGNLLATRYGSFVKSLKRNQIYLRASAAQRCYDTLNLVSSRLWTAFDDAHEPVIYSLPKKVDSLLYEEPHCPDADKEEANNMKKSDVSKYENSKDIKALYAHVAKETGVPATMSGVTKAFDCVRCEKINGYPVPKWASANNTYEKMGDVYTKNLNFLYSSEKSRRLRAGPMLQEVIDQISAIKAANTEASKQALRRAYIYTTHDYKISALLLALGENLQQYPPFAATVIFEVRRNKDKKDELDVKAFYISQTVQEPYTIEALKLSKCGSSGILSLLSSNKQCKFNNFSSFLKPYQNVAWTQECGLNTYDGIQAAEDNIGDS